MHPRRCLVTLCVRGFKKMPPQRCLLLFELAGSKKCTRNGVCCSLCLRVQKNVPAIVLVTLCVCGFKKMHPRTELNGCV
jgi:hypothetical protein